MSTRSRIRKIRATDEARFVSVDEDAFEPVVPTFKQKALYLAVISHLMGRFGGGVRAL